MLGKSETTRNKPETPARVGILIRPTEFFVRTCDLRRDTYIEDSSDLHQQNGSAYIYPKGDRLLV